MKFKDCVKVIYYSKIVKLLRKYPQWIMYLYRNNRMIKYMKGKRHYRKLPIKVFFILEYPEVWNASKTVYDYMHSSEKFNVCVIACPQFPKESPNNALSFSLKNRLNVINGYDNGKWIDISKLNPDFVFYTRPYDKEYPDILKPKNICRFSKVCYIPYGYEFVKGYHLEVEYNLKTFPYMYMIFCDGPSSFEFCNDIYSSKSSKKSKKMFNIGYPKFDLLYYAIQKPQNEFNIKKKYKTIILWTPRWSLDGVSNDGSSFFELYDIILYYVRKRKNIYLIIRPHPLMFKNFVENGKMTQADVEKIYDDIKNIENAEFDRNFDYLNSILKADIILSDFSSMLIDYFVLNKLTIYCGKTNSFDNIGKKIISTMYLLDDKKNLYNLLDELQHNGDVLKEKRSIAINEVISKFDGNAGKRISEAIIKEWQSDNGGE